MPTPSNPASASLQDVKKQIKELDDSLSGELSNIASALRSIEGSTDDIYRVLERIAKALEK